MIDFAALAAPFPADRVSWRVGSTTQDKKKGMALAYIDARDVYDRLDAVCGPAGWQCRYPLADKKTVCEIGIKVGDEWIWKSNGAGDSDVEAEKGALSDAVKRAAVVWGIGRYLYDLDSPWVPIEPAGRSFAISKEGHDQLRAFLSRKAPPPPKTAPVRIAPNGADAAAAKMVEQINMATTVEALEGTKEILRPDFLRLPREQQQRVAEAVSAKARLLEAA